MIQSRGKTEGLAARSPGVRGCPWFSGPIYAPWRENEVVSRQSLAGHGLGSLAWG